MAIFVAKPEMELRERSVAAKSIEEKQMAVLFMCIRHKEILGNLC